MLHGTTLVPEKFPAALLPPVIAAHSVTGVPAAALFHKTETQLRCYMGDTNRLFSLPFTKTAVLCAKRLSIPSLSMHLKYDTFIILLFFGFVKVIFAKTRKSILK